MKDNRSSLLVVLASILLILLVALLAIWGYNYYNSKRPIAKNETKEAINVTQTPIESSRDSVQRMYSETIRSLDNTLDSAWTSADSLKDNLAFRLTEFYKLRSEINAILKTSPNTVGLSVARQKIGELQQKIEDLKNRNKDVESENKRLYSLLQQLNANSKKTDQSTVRQNSKTSFNDAAVTNTNSNSLFTASQLKLMALGTDGEAETTRAEEVEKITGSFEVKSTGKMSGAEIIIVVTQPNGKVLKNSDWDTGIFETKDEGRKMYSQKMRFDYSKGEVKKCSFSLSADKYYRGNYSLQVYHNGILIANLVKTLS